MATCDKCGRDSSKGKTFDLYLGTRQAGQTARRKVIELTGREQVFLCRRCLRRGYWGRVLTTFIGPPLAALVFAGIAASGSLVAGFLGLFLGSFVRDILLDKVVLGVGIVGVGASALTLVYLVMSLIMLLLFPRARAQFGGEMAIEVRHPGRKNLALPDGRVVLTRGEIQVFNSRLALLGLMSSGAVAGGILGVITGAVIGVVLTINGEGEGVATVVAAALTVAFVGLAVGALLSPLSMVDALGYGPTRVIEPSELPVAPAGSAMPAPTLGTV